MVNNLPPQTIIPKPPDQVLMVRGSWDHFKLIQRGLEQNPRVRLFYYDGQIELLMPGREQEIFGHIIGCLVSIFLARRGVFFSQPVL